MPLSDVQIRNAKGTEKTYKLADFAGLFLLVKPSGSRLWQMKYRFDGKEKLLSFGVYPAVALVQARARRDDARALLANGADPGLIKQEQKALQREAGERTFGKLADELLAKMAKEGKSEATLRKIEWLLRLAKDDLGQRPITDIKPPEVLKCLRKVEDKGNHESARRLRATIGSVFRFAVAKGVAENDPTFALQGALIRPTVKPRAAITDPVKLGGLMRAIDGFNGQTTTRIGLQLMALLVPRPGELRAATIAFP